MIDVGDGVMEPEWIRARHLLIKHKDCNQITDYRRDPPDADINSDDPQDKVITRTREEALKIITDLHESGQITGENFEEYAFKYSECASYLDYDNLGRFGKFSGPDRQAHKTMEDDIWQALINLDVGGVSGVIETDRGFHLVCRESLILVIEKDN